MIIGISGKIGSGKDTVGKIVQYLTSGFVNQSTDHFLVGLNNNYPIVDTEWQIKKFAGKLKQIVSLLTGIPVEDLEKPEIKDSILGEEWDIIIAKNFLTGEVYHKKEYTVRYLLQRVGTESMRDVIHENVWVNALFADYKVPILNGKISNLAKDGDYPNWIITDMRFPNELEAVKSRGGITIRVKRDMYLYSDGNTVPVQYVPEKERDKYLVNRDSSKEHPSETALDNYNFDYIIDNNGTIEELVDKVKQLLIKKNII